MAPRSPRQLVIDRLLAAKRDAGNSRLYLMAVTETYIETGNQDYAAPLLLLIDSLELIEEAIEKFRAEVA